MSDEWTFLLRKEAKEFVPKATLNSPLTSKEQLRAPEESAPNSAKVRSSIPIENSKWIHTEGKGRNQHVDYAIQERYMGIEEQGEVLCETQDLLALWLNEQIWGFWFVIPSPVDLLCKIVNAIIDFLETELLLYQYFVQRARKPILSVKWSILKGGLSFAEASWRLPMMTFRAHRLLSLCVIVMRLYLR